MEAFRKIDIHLMYSDAEDEVRVVACSTDVLI